MRRKVSKKDGGEFEKDKWLDAENNLRDPHHFCEFIVELFRTRDKLSKKELFELLGGEQQFRKLITASTLRFKERYESKVRVHRLIAYVYFHLQFLLRESN
jgi:hypothetical protein